MSQFVYKIRRVSDGKFSSGTSTPHFSRDGKCWTSRAALHSHFTLIRDYRKTIEHLSGKLPEDPYKGCEIVTFAQHSTEGVAEYQQHLFNQQLSKALRKV